MIYKRIENTRWLFNCSKCGIAKIIDNQDRDNAYVAFLEFYDEHKLEPIPLDELLVREGLIRSSDEIKYMLKGIDDRLIHGILETKQDYIAYYELLKDSNPDLGSSVEDLSIDPRLKDRLKSNGISRLFRFQEEAIYSIMDGKDVVIVAPTASGKTEAFTIPILEGIDQGFIQALFIYPTKALARDQASKINNYADAVGIRIAILDGDTSINEKREIISTKPEIILTNFDTLHYHLMYRTEFSTLLDKVRYIVIDEVHTYTGIFGSHVHYILKRLARFSKFNIIAASATLPNAKEFCERLFDRSVNIIEGKGKRGNIHFAMIYPTLRSQRALMLDLLKRLCKEHKTIVFSDSHIDAELLAYYASKEVKIKVHRAGLIQEYRNKVEDEFKRGELMAISSTPTLELGIDIGDLDAVISDKTPINRFMQRMGRAARKSQIGYAFLTFGNDPISQYYKNHPEDYLNDLEYAYIDPYNPTVQKYQLLAMACDKPLPDSYYDEYSKVIDELIDEDLLRHANNRFIPNYRLARRVLSEINIRGSGKSVKIYTNNKRVGERALPIALEELHDDAVYFLAGKRYKVDKLDLKGEKAYLTLLLSNYPYYTRALSEEWPSIEAVYEQRYVYNIQVMYCLLHITKRVIGYANLDIGSQDLKGEKVMLDRVLEYDFITKGLVFRAPRLDADYTKSISAYHASEHVLIEGSRMITGVSSQDIGGISLGSSGLIFIYDANIGGNGASKVLYDRLEQAFVRSKDILEECRCKSESGCPRCTYSYRCGNNNEYLHKYGALEVFKSILANVESKVEDIEADRSLV